MQSFALYHGAELKPERGDGHIVLSSSLEAKGYGAILATHAPPSARVSDLLKKMAALSSKPLESFSHEWKAITQRLVEILHSKAPLSPPEGMIKIPAGEFLVAVSGI